MKKTLLIAAAALVAATITSEAQVYSANIVGYVNHVNTAGEYDLIANPLTTGNDVLTNVLTGVSGSSTVQYWNGSAWVAAQYSSKTGHWLSGGNNVDNTALPVGVGFFYSAGSTGTNTFVGSVVGTAGSSVTNSIPEGVYSPVGELIPYADTVTNTSTVNLQVAGSSVLQIWSVGTQGFSNYQFSSKTGNWTPSNPTLNPAQGAFLSPSGSGTLNWVQVSP